MNLIIWLGVVRYTLIEGECGLSLGNGFEDEKGIVSLFLEGEQDI